MVPLPLHLPADPAKVALGERLFHEVRLSGHNTMACVTCHRLERGGADGLPQAMTATGTPLPPVSTYHSFAPGMGAKPSRAGATTREASGGVGECLDKKSRTSRLKVSGCSQLAECPASSIKRSCETGIWAARTRMM